MFIQPYFLIRNGKSEATESQLVFYFDNPLLELNPEKILGEDEKKIFKKFSSKKRERSFLSGRIVAKQALLAYLKIKKPINSFNLLNGESHFPFFKEINASTSLSHSGDIAAATVTHPQHHIGLDIEKKEHFSFDENLIPLPKILVGYRSIMESLRYTWVAMESLSKVLRIGFTSPLEMFTLSKICFETQSCALCEYVNFPNFKCLVLDLGSYLFGICYFSNSTLEIDVDLLQKNFSKMEQVNDLPKTLAQLD